jgi:glutamyl-tRNA synthetase
VDANPETDPSTEQMNGRFAPSPSGPLHLGNLRTALVAWLFARSTDSRFIVRMEDLDPVTSKPEHEDAQLADLEALGLDWDGVVVRQSDRLDLYRDAISQLSAAGLVYPCWCSRREIAEASQAPNRPDLPDGAYPGTCRELTTEQRNEKRDSGRQPALRLYGHDQTRSFIDAIRGPIHAVVDDVVLARADGMPAYNLAVVVDDALQGVQQVVRGDDLLTSTPRQILLGELLKLPLESYAHVPLAVNAEGKRLAKRDGSVTLADQRKSGRSPSRVCAILGTSLGFTTSNTARPRDFLDEFPSKPLTTTPWYLPESLLGAEQGQAT